MKQKEEKKLFPAQEKSELVLDIIRKHWFTYMIFWFITFIMSLPLLVGSYLWFNGVISITPVWENVIIIFVPIYLLFILALLVYGFVDFYLDVYIITDRRIVDIAQNGLFKRTISELNLRQIQDVKATVIGIFSTLLHFGDVNIQTAGDKPNFVFRAIPHPYETSKKILDLHEAYLQRAERKTRGLINGSKKLEANIIQDSSIPDTIDTNLTDKWFEENSEYCYSDETCRQKLLEGINKQIAIDKATKQNKKEGELKEGEEVDL